MVVYTMKSAWDVDEVVDAGALRGKVFSRSVVDCIVLGGIE